MRAILLLTILFSPILSIGQSIKTNKIDKFTKQRIIETSFEKIAMKNGGGVWIAFQRIGEIEAVFLTINSRRSIMGVSEGADLIFLDNDENTYTFKNRHREISSHGPGTMGYVGTSEYYIDLYFEGDLSVFKDKEFSQFRIYATGGYIDYNISSNAPKKIKELYKVYENEILKSQEGRE